VLLCSCSSLPGTAWRSSDPNADAFEFPFLNLVSLPWSVPGQTDPDRPSAMLRCPACGGGGVEEAGLLREAHCMPRCGACNKVWPAAFLVSALSAESLARVRAARREAALQLASAALPAALPALQLWQEKKDLYAGRDALVREHGCAVLARDDLRRQRQAARAETARVAALIYSAAGEDKAGAPAGVCSRAQCGGALVNGECVSCFSRACAECGDVVSRDGHRCDMASVLSRRVIAQATRPCPRCAAPIARTEGCMQMYCTQCSAKFAWDTGALIGERAFFENPHFYAARQAAAHANDATRRCWYATLTRARNRVGSSRAARVLFCIAVRQAMHLTELLGPSLVRGWCSPFAFPGGRERISSASLESDPVSSRGAQNVWTNPDLEHGDQPGAVSCRGKVRVRLELGAERERFAAGRLSESLFKRRIERVERRAWQFGELARLLGTHVAAVGDVATAWLSVADHEYMHAHDLANERTEQPGEVQLEDMTKQAKAQATALDVAMLRGLLEATRRTVSSLSNLPSIKMRDTSDVLLAPPLRSTCADSTACQRHRFAPQRWLTRLCHTRDQIDATLATLDFDAEPRGHAALIRFDFVYERALSARSLRYGPRGDSFMVPGLLCVALCLQPHEAYMHRCRCAHCELARTFDEMRRGACEEDRAELDATENEEHARLEQLRTPWSCYERDRDQAVAVHNEMFP